MEMKFEMNLGKKKKQDIDISVIITFYKDGDQVGIFLDDLISELNKLDRTWEILATEADVPGNSIPVLKEYSDKYPNFFTVIKGHSGVAVTDKTSRYILGFKMAQGKYIVTMDSDGQDVPSEMHKLLTKLDEGYDFVIGSKMNRKDGKFYMMTSALANFINRVLFKVTVKDMNNGYKAFKAEVAKETKLRGGMFRFLPAILTARKLKVTDVPVRTAERLFGEGRFNFISRLQGGGFDLLLTYILVNMGDTPMYFTGWTGVVLLLLSLPFLLLSILLVDMYWKIFTLIAFAVILLFALLVLLLGIALSYMNYVRPIGEEELMVREVYPDHPNISKHKK